MPPSRKWVAQATGLSRPATRRTQWTEDLCINARAGFKSHSPVVPVGGSLSRDGRVARATHARRNIIAAETEKVIDPRASRSFSRAEFLKSLVASKSAGATTP